MKWTIYSYGVACLLFSAGCDSLIGVPKPVGEPVAVSELNSLQGVWVDDEGNPTEVHVSRSGDLVLGAMGWDHDEDQFHVRSATLTLTRIGEHKFLFVPLVYETPQGVLFFRFERPDEKTVRLYLPTRSIFQQAIESHQLEGKIDADRIVGLTSILITSGEELPRFLADKGIEACFEKQPKTFKLLKTTE